MTSHPPFGQWPSPMTPQMMAGARRLGSVAWGRMDGDDHLVWVEGRGADAVLVGQHGLGDAPREMSTDLSVRARVGYGGGEVGAGNDLAVFVSEGRLYRRPLRPGQAVAITPPHGEAAAPCISPDGRWVLYVHSDGVTDVLAIVDAQGRYWPQKLVSGADFYMQPRWHPSGRWIAWASWDHPHMPWERSTLCLGSVVVDDDALPRLASSKVVTCGQDEDGAVFQAEFSPDGRYLSYVSDRTGRDALYLYDLEAGQERLLYEEEGAELGTPAWAQDLRTYAWSADSRALYVSRNRDAERRLIRVGVPDGSATSVDALGDYTVVSRVVGSARGRLALVASRPDTPARLLVYDPQSGALSIAARSDSEDIPPDRLVAPRHLTWPSIDGENAHGLLYLPHEKRLQAAARPPLVVLIHGGPTSQSLAEYSSRAQFFATRGYAVLEVNYRGSTGYGRAYRRRLEGNWGIIDADDAVSGARYVAEHGWADGERLAIMGGSAGGFTVLQCLIRYPGVFRAGVCVYGVADLFALATDTHKFERHYTDWLVGPLPEAAELYRARSPVYHADGIKDPLAVFQGAEDRVVPPGQAEALVAALRRSGVPHEYHLYEGEGHGWRRPETIVAFYVAVESFLKRHLLMPERGGSEVGE